jgi:Zn-dependent protease with chaperone function
MVSATDVALLCAALLIIVWWHESTQVPGVVGVVPVRAAYSRYRVHENLPNSEAAATRLAQLERRSALLLDHIFRRYLLPTEQTMRSVGAATSPAAQAARRLAARYSPDSLAENAPGIDGTAFTIDKGEMIAMCLRENVPGAPLAVSRDGYRVDDVLAFVFYHELGHVAANDFGHGDEFWSTFKWILLEAVDAGLVANLDFASRPTSYCGLKIDHNPLFDPDIAPLATDRP